ncbi:hypothetical protein VUR80DRAFT_3884 [Thermomyces stellatus]
MSPIPPTMKAIQVAANGGPEVLTPTSLPVPQPAEGEVLVKNSYVGINFIDTYFRTGLYPTPLPFVPGREGAGTVVATHPSVTGVSVGDSVVYMSNNTAYAEYTVAPSKLVLKVPPGLTEKDAAASLIQGLTAWSFIREAGQVKAGQWVFVHAAAGGTGGLLVQMLRTVGAKIIGTGSTKEKLEIAKNHGADYVLNSKEDDIPARVKEITGGHGVDVVFDGVGKATFDSDLEIVARKGTVIVFGNASGPVPPVELQRLGAKNVKLMRPAVFAYLVTREEIEGYAKDLFGLITEGKVKIGIHEVYPLNDAKRAHEDLEAARTTGKLLLKIGEY